MKHLGPVTLCFVLWATTACREEAGEVACPPGAARDSRNGDLCVCKEEGEQMVSGLQGMSYPACDPIDTRDFQGAWLLIETFADLGYGMLSPYGVIDSDVFCSAELGPRNFLERDDATCSACDCAAFGECIPAGCRAACGVDKVCGAGQTCLADGSCATCGFMPGQIQCGGGPDGCGACPGGTMCVEGLCSALLRCQVSPSSLCDVPDWCPVDVRNLSGPAYPGASCFCNYPANGGTCQTFYGSLEFF